VEILGAFHFGPPLVPGQLDVAGNFGDLGLHVLDEILDLVGVFACFRWPGNGCLRPPPKKAPAVFAGARGFDVAMTASILVCTVT